MFEAFLNLCPSKIIDWITESDMLIQEHFGLEKFQSFYIDSKKYKPEVWSETEYDTVPGLNIL